MSTTETSDADNDGLGDNADAERKRPSGETTPLGHSLSKLNYQRQTIRNSIPPYGHGEAGSDSVIQTPNSPAPLSRSINRKIS